MNHSDENVPKWVLQGRLSINLEKQHLQDLRRYAKAEIQRGLELDRTVRERESAINYAEQVFLQDLPASAWHDEIASASGTHLAGTVNAFEQHDRGMVGLYKQWTDRRDEEHTYVMNATYSTATTAASIAYLSASVDIRLHYARGNDWPAPIPVPAPVAPRAQTLASLREQLHPFDSKYLHMLDGSEQALQSSGPDHLGHAAHSMRDLFQSLMMQLAPAGIVAQQPWFETHPTAPGSVSRQQRLKFLLGGSTKEMSDEALNQLDMTAEAAKLALDLVINRAHAHDPELTQEEVELAIDHARYWLLQVLLRYRAWRA